MGRARAPSWRRIAAHPRWSVWSSRYWKQRPHGWSWMPVLRSGALPDEVLVPYWRPDLEPNLIQKTADLAVQYGWATTKPNMKQLLGS